MEQTTDSLALSDAYDGDDIDRQQNEITLLEAMYPGSLRITRPPGTHNSTTAELELQLDEKHTLLISLPQTYPQTSLPRISLSFRSDIGDQVRREARTKLKEILERQELGIECIDLVASEFQQVVNESQSEAREDIGASDPHRDESLLKTNPRDDSINGQQSDGGLRVVLWMHHILATSKRKAIVQRSKELSLGGFSKPGYPGAVYVEGNSNNVTTFVDELKAMRWQAIQERGSETVPIQDLQLTALKGAGIEEVEGLGDIVERLKQAYKDNPQTAEFFLQCMKIK